MSTCLVEFMSPTLKNQVNIGLCQSINNLIWRTLWSVNKERGLMEAFHCYCFKFTVSTKLLPHVDQVLCVWTAKEPALSQELQFQFQKPLVSGAGLSWPTRPIDTVNTGRCCIGACEMCLSCCHIRSGLCPVKVSLSSRKQLLCWFWMLRKTFQRWEVILEHFTVTNIQNVIKISNPSLKLTVGQYRGLLS